ncbi:MAG: hypothetical protein WBG18_22130, partial [Xanthobacteraceae bacterium]
PLSPVSHSEEEIIARPGSQSPEMKVIRFVTLGFLGICVVAGPTVGVVRHRQALENFFERVCTHPYRTFRALFRDVHDFV